MGTALFASYMNETRVVAMDRDLQVTAEVAIITWNTVSVQLKLRI